MPSVTRVQDAALAKGLSIRVREMPASTRTAADAAAACGCQVAQIVKSLVFSGATTGELKLLLVSGSRTVDLDKAAAVVGEPLDRADPKAVRRLTGFAIGGVAPFGHLQPIDAWMDATLLAHDRVWAAAGAPNAVFEVDAAALAAATGATVADIT